VEGKETKVETRESADNLRPISQILRCLQEHSQQNLTAAARKIQAPTFLSSFGAIVDGQVWFSDIGNHRQTNNKTTYKCVKLLTRELLHYAGKNHLDNMQQPCLP